MDVNRSSYYKWLKIKDTIHQYELDRAYYMKRIMEIHHKHAAYGYHAIDVYKRQISTTLSIVLEATSLTPFEDVLTVLDDPVSTP